MCERWTWRVSLYIIIVVIIMIIGCVRNGKKKKHWEGLEIVCHCTLLSHIAPITAVTFSSHDGPAQFVSLAIDVNCALVR